MHQRGEQKVPSFTLRTLDLFFLEERFRELLNAKFQEKAFQDCFLVELHLHGGNRLEVFFDCDKGVTLEKCLHLSRFLEAHINENQWLGENYSIEVSSPGVSRPLKFWRQYRKNIGRILTVTLRDGELKTGTLKEVHDDYILLEEKRTERVGKKKNTISVDTEIPFDHIERSVIQISI